MIDPIPAPDPKPQEPVPSVSIPPAQTERIPIRFSSFLPRSRSKVVFALVMACYSVGLNSFIGTWARVAGVPKPPRAIYGTGDVADVISALLIAPVVESLMLVAVFELLRRAHAPKPVQLLAAAAFISELHVWPWWPLAVIVLPAFCIQAGSYLYWRERRPWKEAFWVVVLIHALSNVIPTLSAIGRAMRHA